MDGSPMDEEEYSDKIDYYLSIGVVELVGMDENGEIIYQITDKAEFEAPELWQAHQEFVDEALIDLYEQGLISIEYNENLEAMINLSPEGYEKAKEMGLIELEEDQDIPND